MPASFLVNFLDVYKLARLEVDAVDDEQREVVTACRERTAVRNPVQASHPKQFSNGSTPVDAMS